MPVSPAHPCRFRSESYELRNSTFSKRKLFPMRKNRSVPVTSVDYWLPSYDEAEEDEIFEDDFSKAFDSLNNIPEINEPSKCPSNKRIITLRS